MSSGWVNEQLHVEGISECQAPKQAGQKERVGVHQEVPLGQEPESRGSPLMLYLFL